MSNTKVNSPTVNEFYSKLASTGGTNLDLLLDSNFRVKFTFNEDDELPLIENLNTVYNNIDVHDSRNMNLKTVYNKFANNPNRDITYLVQAIDIPNLKATMEKNKVENMFGGMNYPTLGAVEPNRYDINIDFVSTESLFIENLIIPWMMQLKSAVWVYPSRPYATATITVDIFDQSGKNIVSTYRLHEAVPNLADTLDLSHTPTKQFIRTVNFTFDHLSIENNTKVLTVEAGDNIGAPIIDTINLDSVSGFGVERIS